MDPKSKADLVQYELDSLGIVVEDLQTEFVRWAGQMSYWCAQHAKAWELAQKLELQYDEAWARTYLKNREPKEDANGKMKSPSVEDAKAATDCDPEIVELREDMIKARAEEMRLRGVSKAVDGKKDMLQSLGANARREQELRMFSRRREEDASDWADAE